MGHIHSKVKYIYYRVGFDPDEFDEVCINII